MAHNYSREKAPHLPTAKPLVIIESNATKMSKIKKYKSPRNFRVWFYTVSHSTLIIRSEKQYPDVDYETKYDDSSITIDLEFSGVRFISVPENFNGLEIERLGNRFIINGDENCFVEAHSCVIGKSTWDYDEDVFSGMNYQYNEKSVLE